MTCSRRIGSVGHLGQRLKLTEFAAFEKSATFNLVSHKQKYPRGLQAIVKILASIEILQKLGFPANYLRFSLICPKRKTEPTNGGWTRQLLKMANALLDNWSNDFMRLSKKHKIWSSLWLKHLEEYRDDVFKPAPFWLWETVSADLERKKYHSTSIEIKAAIRYLQMSNKPINSF